MLYAYSEVQKDPALEEVDLEWLYLRTTEPHKCKPVHLKILRDDAVAAMRALDDMAAEVWKIVIGQKDSTTNLFVIMFSASHTTATSVSPSTDRVNLAGCAT